MKKSNNFLNVSTFQPSPSAGSLHVKPIHYNKHLVLFMHHKMCNTLK